MKKEKRQARAFLIIKKRKYAAGIPTWIGIGDACLTSLSPGFALQRATCADECQLSDHYFYQPEHGIRDYKVTEVQTCALPICVPRHIQNHGSGGQRPIQRFFLTYFV